MHFSLFFCTVLREYYFIDALSGRSGHSCVCIMRVCVCVFLMSMLCVKIAVGSESESECCRSCCYRSHSAPCSFCCCCFCFIFFLAPLLLLVLSMFVVFLWSNICADSDSVLGSAAMRQISKGYPIWPGRGHNENVLWSVCGNTDRESQVCTHKFIWVRRTNMYLCMWHVVLQLWAITADYC